MNDIREQAPPPTGRPGRALSTRGPVWARVALVAAALAVPPSAGSSADRGAFLAPVPDEAAAPAAASTFASIRAAGSNPTAMHRVVANAPEIFAAYVGLAYAIRSDGHVPRQLRELAILRALQLEQSTYEMAPHSRMARSCGITDAQLASLGAWRTADGFSPEQRAVLAWVDGMASPGGPSDETYREMESHFDPHAVVEITMAAGFYTMAGRTTKVLRITPEMAGAASAARYGAC